MTTWIESFVEESNGISGIHRPPTKREIQAHKQLLKLQSLSVDCLIGFVSIVQPGAVLRDKPNMDIRGKVALESGELVTMALETLLSDINDPDHVHIPLDLHQEYESIAPFTDANGRSGRAIWLWQMSKIGQLDTVKEIGFLRAYYHQSFNAWGKE